MRTRPFTFVSEEFCTLTVQLLRLPVCPLLSCCCIRIGLVLLSVTKASISPGSMRLVINFCGFEDPESACHTTSRSILPGPGIKKLISLWSEPDNVKLVFSSSNDEGVETSGEASADCHNSFGVTSEMMQTSRSSVVITVLFFMELARLIRLVFNCPERSIHLKFVASSRCVVLNT